MSYFRSAKNFMSLMRQTSFCVALALIPASISFAIESGSMAPEFELPTQTATTLKLSQYKGKVVYLDFWASWCGPCRQSFPWMNELQTRFSEQGLQIVAINLDVNTEDAQKFLVQTPAQFAIAYDNKGITPKMYGVKGMPTSYLIGRDGKILFQHIGFHSTQRADLETKIKNALSDKK